MTIAFACSECERKLKVKDELAGRKVKCPSCGASIAVPSEEAVIEGPPPRKSRPPEDDEAPPVREHDDADEGDKGEEEERPRKKKKKKKKTEKQRQAVDRRRLRDFAAFAIDVASRLFPVAQGDAAS